MIKTWMITGASKGLGLALVNAALAAGDRVVATARDTSALRDLLPPSDGLLILPLDATSPEQIGAAVEIAIARFGAVDILVNNAAYALIGAVEEVSPAELDTHFRTNFFGPVELIRQVLPHMRAKGAGHIINISSVGIFGAVGGGSSYAASKWALEGMSECLAKEVAPLGIAVTVVEPGMIKSDFYNMHPSKLAQRKLPEYDLTAGRVRGMFSGAELPGALPEDMADAILKLAASDNPPLRFLLGSDAIARFEGWAPGFNPDVEAWRDISTMRASERA